MRFDQTIVFCLPSSICLRCSNSSMRCNRLQAISSVQLPELPANKQGFCLSSDVLVCAYFFFISFVYLIWMFTSSGYFERPSTRRLLSRLSVQTSIASEVLGCSKLIFTLVCLLCISLLEKTKLSEFSQLVTLGGGKRRANSQIKLAST